MFQSTMQTLSVSLSKIVVIQPVIQTISFVSSRNSGMFVIHRINEHLSRNLDKLVIFKKKRINRGESLLFIFNFSSNGTPTNSSSS